MSRSRRHHYVPKWLLRRFCFSGKSLYYYSRHAADKGVHARNINSVFYGSHLNSVCYRTGVIDDGLERGLYQKLDDEAACFVAEVEAAIDAGYEPYVVDESKAFVAHLFYNQFKRTKEFHDHVGLHLSIKDMLKNVAATVEAEFGMSDQERRDFFHPDSVREDEDYVRTQVLAHQGDTVLKALAALIPVFAIAPTGREFIIGGRPVAAFPDPHAQYGREYWMPINPTTAIGLVGETPVNRERRIFAISTDQVRRLNIGWSKQSETFAGKNRNLVQSLVSPR
ncbi:DUF4238 domain-containing protein [Amaricoccus sp.]|uniref:DUF4238 domain-containing protein n=1 Tax=Amaricoccus sp. TaxID=1872485 RepID=UPI001B5D9A0E|nr:DUF4238 domain-containing protein [Amaricoccus sp.]MBP7241335.1 DUF4238 domain-containing protein [Amaricoccus sp.]